MKENVRRSARKLQRDERVIKVRRKLYKSGRTWLVASLATAAFGATIIVSGQSANAETVVNTSSTQTQASPIIQDKTVSLDSSSSVQLSTPPETRNQVATSQSNLSATINADSSTQNNLKSNVINADSVSKPTKADSTSTVDSVNLGNANAETLNTAKTKGTQIYQQTGKAQQITAVAAAASGTLGTSPYEIDDDGAMAIQAGKVNKSIYTIGSGNANAIKTISLADGVSAEIDGGYGALFGNLPNAVAIDVHNLDISKNIGFGGWFTNNPKLTSINVEGWNTSHSTVFANMFFNSQALAGVDLSSFDTSQATDMHSMFQHSGIRTLDLSKFDMSAATNISDMLQGTNHLWQIKLGPKVNLTGTGLADPPVAGAQIIDGANTYHTSAALWQAVGDGTVNAPEGERLSAADLIKKYNGDGTASIETYVWAQDLKNTINLIDASSGQKLDTATVSGEYGAPIDLNTSLPVGYHYATDSELGTYLQPVAPTIGKNDSVLDVYVVVDPKIAVNFIDDDKQDTVVQTTAKSGQLGTASDYKLSDDLADLEQKGYEYVSDDLPGDVLNFNKQKASYTVHLKHKLTTVKGTDSTATPNQQKAISVIIDESTIGTPLTSEQVKPAGDTTQTLIFVRDAVIDEVKKAAGVPVNEYTTFGDWYTNQKMTPVVSAQVEGYTPLASVLDSDSMWDDTRTVNQVLADFAAQSGGNASVTLHNSYRINQYQVAIQYVDQTIGQTVGTIEKLHGDYGTQLIYPAIAPSGYVVVPGQEEIVNNKVAITFGPDTTALIINVTPEITKQLATVTYQTESGTTVALETFSGDSSSEIPFDTANYVTHNLKAYEIKEDATAAGSNFDKSTDSIQNFKVIVALKPISTLITPTGVDGQPIAGIAAIAVTGQPGDKITTIPEIDGYTAVPGQTLRLPEVDNDVTKVYYVANNLTANVHFVDENGVQLANLSVSGIKNSLLNHANVATVTQQILNQGYNLISDDTIGGSFNGTADQVFTVKLAKLADPQTSQNATIKFVSDQPNNFGTLIMNGDSGTDIDHHNIATVIQQILNQGFNLVNDGSVGAVFDSDPTKEQTFIVSFEKIANRPQTGTPTPAEPTGGGETPVEPDGEEPTNPSGPENGEGVPPALNPDIPAGPSNQTVNEPAGDTVPSVSNRSDNNVNGDSTKSKSIPSSLDKRDFDENKLIIAAGNQGMSVRSSQQNQSLNDDDRLPQTGEQTTLPMVIIGMALLTELGVIGLADRRRFKA